MKMGDAETPEHSSLKQIVKDCLLRWFEGASLKEYMVAGHIADVYAVTRDSKRIHAEVVWSQSQFLRNLIALLVSDAHVRCMICSRKVLDISGAYYEKVRLEELKKGIRFTEAFDADLILENQHENLERLHASLRQLTDLVPIEPYPSFPRSYWYVDNNLTADVVKELKEPWEDRSVISRILLLEQEYCRIPLEIDNGMIRFGLLEEEPLSSLSWKKSRKLVKIFGRFYAPFGIEKETMVQFVWDPCYSDYLEIQTLSVHIHPDSIGGSRLDAPLGVEQWQKPSVFVIGLVNEPERWCAPMIEPLAIYRSEEESEMFHSKLVERVSQTHTQGEATRGLYDFGPQETDRAREIAKKEIKSLLLRECWERPVRKILDLSEVLWQASGFLKTIEMEGDKLNEEALKSVLWGFLGSSRVELEAIIHESISELESIATQFRSLLMEILKLFKVEVEFDKICDRRMKFYQLQLKMISTLSESTFRVLKQRGKVYKVEVDMPIDGQKQNIVLEGLDELQVGVLQRNAIEER